MAIKILYIISTLERSGPVNLLYNMVKYLDKRKFTPVILTLSPEKSNSRLKDFLELNIKVESLGLSKIKGMIYQEALKEKIFKEKPDIIHSHGFRADLLNSLIDKNTFYKKVCTIHNYPQFDYSMLYGKFLGNILAKLHMLMIKKMDVIIGVSKSVTKNLITNFKLDPNKTLTISNFIDNEVFQPISDIRLRYKLREKYNLPSKMILFSYIGQLIKRKNIIFLIKTFKRYFSTNENIGLIIVGKGEEEKYLKQASKNLRNIFFLGYQENTAEILHLSDYYISASLAEGLPMSVIEALACGLPVILSNIEPHREIIELNQDIGVLFNPYNELDLKEKILEILKKDYLITRRKILELINNEFSAKIKIKEYENVYKALLQ